MIIDPSMADNTNRGNDLFDEICTGISSGPMFSPAATKISHTKTASPLLHRQEPRFTANMSKLLQSATHPRVLCKIFTGGSQYFRFRQPQDKKRTGHYCLEIHSYSRQRNISQAWVKMLLGEQQTFAISSSTIEESESGRTEVFLDTSFPGPISCPVLPVLSWATAVMSGPTWTCHQFSSLFISVTGTVHKQQITSDCNEKSWPYKNHNTACEAKLIKRGRLQQ